MCPKLKAELYKVIDEWIQRECEKDNWPNIIIGDKTSELMTDAATSVFDAMLESQQYMRREGLE